MAIIKNDSLSKVYLTNGRISAVILLLLFVTTNKLTAQILSYSRITFPAVNEYHTPIRPLSFFRVMEKNTNQEFDYFISERDSILQKPSIPPLHADRITNELIWGVLSGAVTGAVFLSVFRNDVFKEHPFISNLSFKQDMELYYPMYIGAVLGSTFCVHFIGKTGDETGSFYTSLLGSSIGFLLSLPFENKDWRLILPPIGATIGFNITRRYDDTDQESSLISIRKGRTQIGIPKMSINTKPYNAKSFLYVISLVQMKF